MGGGLNGSSQASIGRGGEEKQVYLFPPRVLSRADQRNLTITAWHARLVNKCGMNEADFAPLQRWLVPDYFFDDTTGCAGYCNPCLCVDCDEPMGDDVGQCDRCKCHLHLFDGPRGYISTDSYSSRKVPCGSYIRFAIENDEQPDAGYPVCQRLCNFCEPNDDD